MLNKSERTNSGAGFGCVSSRGSARVSSCDLILTATCQRYDRVITALTPPSARHKNDDAQSSERAVCYQHHHPPNPPHPE